MLTVVMNLLGASRPITGVQRYALELLPHLIATEPQDAQLVVAVDGTPPMLDAIAPSELAGRLLSVSADGLAPRARHLAIQVSLPRLMRQYPGAVLYSPMNVGSLRWPRQLVFVHDLAWRHFPQAYRWPYRALHGSLFAGYRRLRLSLACHSTAVAEDIRSLCPSSTVTVIRCGPGKTAGRLGGRSLREGPRSQVLWVGSLQQRKGLPVALSACSEAARVLGRQIDLVLVGGDAGPFRRQVIPSASGVVVHVGHRLDDTDLEDAYRSADVLLFTSRYEGFGLPPIEALVRGVPVICSDLPSLREFPLVGITFVDPEDVHGFASALVEELGATSPTLTEPPPLSWARCAEDTWRALRETSRRE